MASGRRARRTISSTSLGRFATTTVRISLWEVWVSRRRRFVLFACAICFIALGCSSPNYDPPTLIKGFRVLAVKVEPPFVGLQPAEASAFVVRVTPGQSLCYAWALCPFAWENEGNYECLDPRLQVDLGNDATASLSLLDLFEVFELLPQVIEDKGLNPPRDVNPGGGGSGGTDEPDDEPEIDGGLSVQLLFQISEARVWGGVCPRDTALMLGKPCPTRDGCLQGHKALNVALPPEDGGPSEGEHSNPKLTGMLLDEVLWPEDVSPSVHFPAQPKGQGEEGEGVILEPTWSPESVELVRKSVDPGVPDTYERLTMSFFSDAGRFDYRRTGNQAADNSFSASMPTGQAREVTLWVVLRDDRGGVDWLTRTLWLDPNAPVGAHPLCEPDPNLKGCDEVQP